MKMQNNDDTEEKGADWLDLKAIKANTEVKPVLEHFEILEYLEPKGAELVGWCPLGHEHGKEDSFAFNIEKKTFQCFACKSRGSILDFIAKYKEVTLREAGKIAMQIALNTSEEMIQENLPETKSHRPYDKPKPPVDNTKETIKTKKHPDKPNNLLFYSWEQAQNLINTKTLSPAQLLVLDINGLNLFLKNSEKSINTD